MSEKPTYEELKRRVRQLERAERDRLTAEDDLRRGEENYRRILENSVVGFFQSTPEGRFITVNRAFARMLGYFSPEELIGTISDIPTQYYVNPEDRRRYQQILQLEGQVNDFEVQVRCKDRSVIWVSTNTRAEFDADGSVLRYEGVMSDITERKRAEEALFESERKWRNILLRTPQIGVSLDPEGRIVFANAHLLKLTGWSEPEVLGRDWFDLFIPEPIREEIRKVFRTVMSRKDTLGFSTYENEIVTRTGELRNVAWSNVLTQDARGQVIDVTCLGIDLTERRRTEEALRESEEKFRLTFAASPDAVNINRLEDGLYIDVNEGFTRLTGFAREDVIGKTSVQIRIWHDPADRQRLVRELEQKGYCENLEARFRRKDGSLATALMSARIIALKGVPHIISITRDISERKAAEEERKRLHLQLMQAQKMEAVGRLAGGVAHDFNNMLGVILGHAEMALEDLDPSQPLHSALQEIRAAAERSGRLTRQLLGFASRQAISPRRLDLNETVAGMLEMLRRLISEDIELAWRPGPDLWPIRIDPGQIDQILANLLVNARDAIAGVGRVAIETKNRVLDAGFCRDHPDFVPGEYVGLTVSDDGRGMDKATLDQVFEPFFTTKDVGKGSGLGLATIFGIVRQNDGRIQAESEPGEGTTFRIYFPRFAGETEEEDDREGQKPPTPEPVRKRVLLVEDETAILKMTGTLLERLGYHVLSAGTPGEAVRLAEEHAGEIHLLITDVVMPEMNGRDLAVRLKTLYPELKCLFMSGYTADVIARSGVLDKGMHFIQKPFSKKALEEAVVAALAEKTRGAAGRPAGA